LIALMSIAVLFSSIILFFRYTIKFKILTFQKSKFNPVTDVKNALKLY
jgi:hypothetical protein